jgi:hypothetical protein
LCIHVWSCTVPGPPVPARAYAVRPPSCAFEHGDSCAFLTNSMFSKWSRVCFFASFHVFKIRTSFDIFIFRIIATHRVCNQNLSGQLTIFQGKCSIFQKYRKSALNSFFVRQTFSRCVSVQACFEMLKKQQRRTENQRLGSKRSKR